MRLYEINGVERKVPTGFSWTTLLFGFFPALFRGDLKWVAIMLITNIVVAFLTLGFGLLVTWIVFAAIYNGKYENDLKIKGWKRIDRVPTAD